MGHGPGRLFAAASLLLGMSVSARAGESCAAFVRSAESEHFLKIVESIRKSRQNFFCTGGCRKQGYLSARQIDRALSGAAIAAQDLRRGRGASAKTLFEDIQKADTAKAGALSFFNAYPAYVVLPLARVGLRDIAVRHPATPGPGGACASPRAAAAERFLNIARDIRRSRKELACSGGGPPCVEKKYLSAREVELALSFGEAAARELSRCGSAGVRQVYRDILAAEPATAHAGSVFNAYPKEKVAALVEKGLIELKGL